MESIPLEVLYSINTYLSISEIINIYSCTTYYSNTFNMIKPINEIRKLHHPNSILNNLNSNFTIQRKKLFSKYYYNNIPKNVRTINSYLRWIYIFKMILFYYNISFFENDIILFTSKGSCNIFTICKNILNKLQKKPIYNYIYNRPSGVLNSLAKERNITELCKNWYHQLEYKQLADLVFELAETFKL